MKHDENYKSLARVLVMAYKRAAEGKGREHHSRGEPFDQQWICRGTRVFGIGGPLFQVGKKSEQSVKMLSEGKPRDAIINELLDGIVYLSAAVIVLEEE